MSVLILLEVCGIGLNLQLMRVFNRPLARILEINGNGNWKHSVACVVNLKGRRLNRDQGFGKAFMNLKLNSLDEEGQVLFLHWVIWRAALSKTSNITAPLVRECPVLPRHDYCLFEQLGDGPDDDWNRNLGSFDSGDD